MKSFFEKIRFILEKERIQLEEKRARGELFNIFDVLGLTSNEVRTHSAFIAELLNPNGSHGLGALPLSLFVDLLDKRGIPVKFDAKNAFVVCEKYIGPINNNSEEGGILDILIESKSESGEKSAILVENKIYADDQNQQLIRYNNFGKANYHNKFVLLYLTLDNRTPKLSSIISDKTQVNRDEDYWPISYQNEIRRWIESCLSVSYGKPLIRETLHQYLSLILNLSNNMENSNIEVVREMIDNAPVVTKLLTVQNEYKQTVINTTLKESFERFAKENNLLLEIPDSFLNGVRWSGLSLRKSEWRHAAIFIVPENNQSNYWIGHIEDKALNVEHHALSMLKDGVTDKYPFGTKWLPGCYRYLYDAQTIEDIISGKFIQVVGDLIQSIIEEAESEIPNFKYL
jgi:hypothetical protein